MRIVFVVVIVAAVGLFAVLDLAQRGPSSWSGADRLLLGARRRNLLSGYGSVYDRVVHTGIAAQGILLTVELVGAPAPRSGKRRFEYRSVSIDLEVPGKPPYERRARLIVPSRMVDDILPGATLEVRIDRWNSFLIAVVGPGAGIAATSLLAASPPT